MNSQYFLNICPVVYKNQDILIGKSLYKDEIQLKQLRDSNKKTHIFIRQSNLIIDIPILVDILPIGKPETIKLLQNIGICTELINQGLIKFFQNSGISLNSFKPISFLKNNKDNILHKIPQLKNQDNFSIYSELEIVTRPLTFPDTEQSVYLVFNIRYVNFINDNCEVLLNKGIELIGKYVKTYDKNSDRFLTVGKIKDINGKTVSFEDVNPRFPTQLELDKLFLEARNENFKECLKKYYPKYSKIEEDLKTLLDQERNGINRLKQINEYVKSLKSIPIEIAPNIKINIGYLLNQKNDTFPKIDKMQSPTYVFDPALQKRESLNDRGLNNYGPYDKAHFSPKKLKIAIICQENKKGRVESFISRFLNGMPDSLYYKKGFITKYALQGYSHDFFIAKNDSAEAYRTATLECIEKYGESQEKYDLAIVQIDKKFKLLPANMNPYLITKSILLKSDIASQEFTYELTSRSEYEIGTILNQMSLATYAKLGGTPWLLLATQNSSLSHELIFGLGSAHIKDGRFGGQSKVVGITTVFTGDGNYVLENRSKAVNYDEYSDQLLSSLKKTIEVLETRYNWSPQDKIRLIFHGFKTFSNDEVEAVKKLMINIQNKYHIEYAFIHIAEYHPYILFDNSQEGVGKVPYLKGKKAPTRGHLIHLNNYESLLTLIGAKEVKKPNDGIPAPLVIKLQKGSTFKDMTYLANQIFTLSGHSWRGFLPSSLPVSLYYSNLIAKQLGELSLIKDWDPTTMLRPIGKTRWFL